MYLFSYFLKEAFVLGFDFGSFHREDFCWRPLTMTNLSYHKLRFIYWFHWCVLHLYANQFGGRVNSKTLILLLHNGSNRPAEWGQTCHSLQSGSRAILKRDTLLKSCQNCKNSTTSETRCLLALCWQSAIKAWPWKHAEGQQQHKQGGLRGCGHRPEEVTTSFVTSQNDSGFMLKTAN